MGERAVKHCQLIAGDSNRQELKVLKHSPGMVLYAAADILIIKSQKESTRVPDEYVMATGSTCPRRPCSTAVDYKISTYMAGT